MRRIRASEHRLTTNDSAAMTCVVGADFVGDLAVDCQAVIDEEFVSRFDGDDSMDKHSIACFDGLAVWCACVVDEARAVATATAVDDPSVGKTKYENVPVPGLLTGGGASPVGHFACVLDEPLACGDRL